MKKEIPIIQRINKLESINNSFDSEKIKVLENKIDKMERFLEKNFNF